MLGELQGLNLDGKAVVLVWELLLHWVVLVHVLDVS